MYKIAKREFIIPEYGKSSQRMWISIIVKINLWLNIWIASGPQDYLLKVIGLFSAQTSMKRKPHTDFVGLLITENCVYKLSILPHQ
jgi:hypothetical protein